LRILLKKRVRTKVTEKLKSERLVAESDLKPKINEKLSEVLSPENREMLLSINDYSDY
jgi:predicted transcriptional regulator